MTQDELEAVAALEVPGGVRVTVTSHGASRYSGAYFMAGMRRRITKAHEPYALAVAYGRTEKEALGNLVQEWMKR